MTKLTEEKLEKIRKVAKDRSLRISENRQSPIVSAGLYKIVVFDDWNFAVMKGDDVDPLGFFPTIRSALTYLINHWAGNFNEIKRAKNIENLLLEIHETLKNIKLPSPGGEE